MQRKHRFGHSATEELYQYWERRRAGRPAPDRAEIEPGDIREILPDTFILEAEDDMRFSWRLAGTRVCALHCRELKGRDFLGDWEGKERETLRSLLEAVVSERAVGVIQFEGFSERDQRLDMEMILLPLNVFGRSTCRVMGAIGTMDMPYWLGIAPPLRRRISHMRMLWPSGMPPIDAQQHAVHTKPITETRPEPLFTLDKARTYRHLMVLDGGKA